MRDAKRKDKKLKQTKETFANVTKDDVIQFKETLKDLFAEYKQSGPGSIDSSLDEGLESLQRFKEKVVEFNKRKDELVLAEKLFNLSISSFKELVQIEEENKRLSVLYETYRELRSNIKEWSTMLWAKLDAEMLR